MRGEIVDMRQQTNEIRFIRLRIQIYALMVVRFYKFDRYFIMLETICNIDIIWFVLTDIAIFQNLIQSIEKQNSQKEQKRK